MPVFTPLAVQLLANHLGRSSDDELPFTGCLIGLMVTVSILLAMTMIAGLVLILALGAFIWSMLASRGLG